MVRSQLSLKHENNYPRVYKDHFKLHPAMGATCVPVSKNIFELMHQEKIFNMKIQNTFG